MGGKKPRGSEPARGSSFSCRSRRGGDFRSLSQELVGGGDKITSHIQEFSLFSSLGVTEIAPWLSDESNQKDSHGVHSIDHEHSHLPMNESICIEEGSGNCDDRIKVLEEITKKLEQKLRSLEIKQKDKENRIRVDNLFHNNLSELKESKDLSDGSKDIKTNAGTVNIERFRTLEGRQAFQQSKFSSLDIVFGGSSSSMWSKGCKKLRSLLLSVDDDNEFNEKIPLKKSFSTNCLEDSKMKAIVRALLSDVDTDVDTDLDIDVDMDSNEKKKDSREKKSYSATLQRSPFLLNSTDTSNLPESKLNGNTDKKKTLLDNSMIPSSCFYENSNNHNEDDIINNDISNNKKDDNNDNSDNNNVNSNDNKDDYSNSSIYNDITISKSNIDNSNSKKGNKSKDIDTIDNNDNYDNNDNSNNDNSNNNNNNNNNNSNIKINILDKSKNTLRECICNQIDILLEKLNSHIKKIQFHKKHVSEDFINSTRTLSKTNYLEKNENELCKYWTEISVLTGRFDSLELHYEDYEDVILHNLNESNTQTNIIRVVSDESMVIDHSNSNHKNNGNYRNNDRKNKKKDKDDEDNQNNLDSSKQKLINMRSSSSANSNNNNSSSSSNNVMNVDNNINNNCNCAGYGYNHDNRAIIYNTRGYPFGYNNHFISGNNYYGYPPYNIQQGENSNFNNDDNSNPNQNQIKNFQSQQNNNNDNNNSNNDNKNNIFDTRDGSDEKFLGPDVKNSSGMSSPHYKQASRPNFDIAKDSLPLRYDSPMSPYASYYVYVPVSGVSTNSTNSPNSTNISNSLSIIEDEKDDCHENKKEKEVQNKSENLRDLI